MLSLFFMAGLSYLVFFLSLSGFLQNFESHLPFLLLIFSFPHFMATYWVWISRVRDWKQEWLPLSFPLIYLVIFWQASLGHLGDSALQVILKCSYLYLMYHFAQQLYGVSLWVSGRSGIFYSRNRKLILRFVFLSASLYGWIEMEMRGVANTLFYRPVPNWGLHSNYIIFAFTAVCIFSLLATVIAFYDYVKTKNLKQLVVMGPMGLAWLWFLPPMGQYLILLLPILHAIQYFPFIKMKSQGLSSWSWLILSAVLVSSGWFFFRWLPFYFPAKPFEETIWAAFVLTFFNNHHFFIDGRIWKLRDPLNQDLL
jgi:hypothetical protein